MSRKWLELQLENACENSRVALVRARKLRQRFQAWGYGQGIAPKVMDELLAVAVDPLADELAKYADKLRQVVTAITGARARDEERDLLARRILARTEDRISSIERIEAAFTKLESLPNGK